MTLISHHLPVQTHHIKFILTLSNLYGECEDIQSKLHIIVLTLLLWVLALSVGANWLN